MHYNNNNNNKGLNTKQIFTSLEKDSIAGLTFKGVFPIDKLPLFKYYPSSLVVNTHRSDQPGEHWLAIYYDAQGYATFFDSFGLHPNIYRLQEYLDQTSKHWTSITFH